MPEFEENNPQKNSTYSYTPSTGTSRKKGGRRRSGGFKSEADASSSKIGEVDPTEALEEEVQKSSSQPDKGIAESENDSPQNSKSSLIKNASGKKSMTEGSRPQPSKATLESIKDVEEKIAVRRAESEKNRPTKTDSSKRKNRNRACKKDVSSSKGGFLATIFQFFGTLLGNRPKTTAAEDTSKKPKRRRPKNQHNRSGSRKDGLGQKRKGNRGNQRSRRTDSSRST